MKRALIVTSVASMIQQFNVPNIKILQELGYQVTVATNYEMPGNIPVRDSIELKKTLELNNVNTLNVCFNRSPLSVDNRKAYNQLKNLINHGTYDLIHCQSPIGGVLTRFAAQKTRGKGTKVIYTAHGFHFYSGAPVKNWLFFYPIEKFLSKYTDVLITINEEDYKRAQTFKANQVEYIPGVGIDLGNIQVNKEKVSKLKKNLELSTDDFVLCSIGELNHNKNHNVVLEALSKLDNKNIKYLVAGTGELKENLTKKVKELNLEEQVEFLGFRDDIYELLYLSDVFIFPSYREGLSRSLMEAMAMGKPIIASDIRGNKDLIDDKEGGLLFNPRNAAHLSEHIITMLNNELFRKTASTYNTEKVKKFSLENVLNKMSRIY